MRHQLGPDVREIARSAQARRVSDTAETLRRIVQLDSETLGISRVNWWSLHEAPPAIRCEAAYERESRAFTSGSVLRESDYPRYFRALREEQLIAADDAVADPRTSEFTVLILTGNSQLRDTHLGSVPILRKPIELKALLAAIAVHTQPSSTLA